jgi:periplasmic protein TonB
MRIRIAFLVLAALLAGCGRAAPGPPAASSRPEPAALLADRAPDVSLPPSASAPAAFTLLRVAPGRGALATAPPEAAPAEPPVSSTPLERLPADDQLRPPVLRSAPPPPPAGARGGWMEFDVRVDEQGAVSDVEPAGGSADSALVRAAAAAVRATRWYPATRGGQPVAVWSRLRLGSR